MDEGLDGYQLVRRLGESELSELYAGVQHGDGGFVREVLIKRLRSEYGMDAESLRAFQREAHLLARMRQRSVPHVYDLRQHPGTGAWLMMMEYVPGPTLHWVMDIERTRNEPLPLPLALTVISQLAGALHHLHELRTSDGDALGMVHRNLAPANVLLGRDGVVRITDFSCVRPSAELDATGSDGRGTAGYMAPEQILGAEPPDRRADVFALGILLYEMSTGTRLYEGHGERLRRALMDKDAPIAHRKFPGFPEALSELLEQVLARDPSLRPATAAELQERVERFAAAQRIPIGSRRLARYLTESFPPAPEQASPVPPATNVSRVGFDAPMPAVPRMSSASRSRLVHGSRGLSSSTPPSRPWTPIPAPLEAYGLFGRGAPTVPEARPAGTLGTEVDGAVPDLVTEEDDTFVGRSFIESKRSPRDDATEVTATPGSTRRKKKSSRPPGATPPQKRPSFYVQKGSHDDDIKKRRK